MVKKRALSKQPDHSMEFHGILWNPVESCGILWNSMEFHGILLWNPFQSGKYALFRNARKMKGLLGREKLSLPLDPYATATDWISPLSLRNFVQIPQPSASLRGGICLKIAPLSLRNSILRLRLGGQSVETICASAMLFFRIKYTVIYSTTGYILNLSVIIAKSHHC